MTRQPVQSSNIAELGHDPVHNELEVAFKSGRVYRYSDVNIDEFAALVNAKSIGSHFANIIKPVKPAQLVLTSPTTGEDVHG